MKRSLPRSGIGGGGQEVGMVRGSKLNAARSTHLPMSDAAQRPTADERAAAEDSRLGFFEIRGTNPKSQNVIEK
jgi:hypothetical protein